MPNPNMKHDPTLCGITVDGSCPACARKMLSLEHLRRVEATLQGLGISVVDLAELLWMRLEPAFEARIRKLADEVLRDRLSRLTFTWRIDK